MPLPTDYKKWLEDITGDLSVLFEELLSSSPGSNRIEKLFNLLNYNPNNTSSQTVKVHNILPTDILIDTIVEETPWNIYCNVNAINVSSVIPRLRSKTPDQIELTEISILDPTVPGNLTYIEKVLIKKTKNSHNVELNKIERERLINKVDTLNSSGVVVSTEYTVLTDYAKLYTHVYREQNTSVTLNGIGIGSVGFDILNRISEQYELEPGEAGKLQRAMMLLPFIGDKVRMEEIKNEMEHPTPIK